MRKDAFLAGTAIAIGMGSYLMIDNKYLGAFIFGFGLFMVCSLKLTLFTGKCGFVNDPHHLARVWLYNLLGMIITFSIFYIATGGIFHDKMVDLFEIKTQKALLQLICSSFICGVLIHVAVTINNKFGGITGQIGCFLAVAAFILSGFDHCVANMSFLILYPFTSGAWSLCLVSTLGNILGAKAVYYLLEK